MMRHDVSKMYIDRKDYGLYLKATCRFTLVMVEVVKENKDKRKAAVVHTNSYQKGYEDTSKHFQTTDCTTERVRGRIKIHRVDVAIPIQQVPLMGTGEEGWFGNLFVAMGSCMIPSLVS